MARDCLAKNIMKTVLRLYITECWPDESKTLWVLLGSNGSVLQKDESTPDHWPVADFHEAIIGGAQTVWLYAQMPEKFPRKEYARLMAGALEEKMLDSLAPQHITAIGNDTGTVGVIVISRERLSDIVSQFISYDRPLQAAYSELQTAPAGDDCWHMTFTGNSTILRRDNRHGVFLDQDISSAKPSPLLATMMGSGENALDSLGLITVHSASDKPFVGVEAWSKALGVPIFLGHPYSWFDIKPGSTNLLQNDFSPRHRKNAWLKTVKPVIGLLLVAIIVDLFFKVANVGWQHHQVNQNRQLATKIFADEFPNVPVIDPPLQLTQQLDELRGPRGFLRSDDALVLIAGVADSMAATGSNTVQEIRYEAGALEIKLARASSEQLDTLKKQLASKGFSTIVKDEANGMAHLNIRRGGTK